MIVGGGAPETQVPSGLGGCDLLRVNHLGAEGHLFGGNDAQDQEAGGAGPGPAVLRQTSGRPVMGA